MSRAKKWQNCDFNDEIGSGIFNLDSEIYFSEMMCIIIGNFNNFLKSINLNNNITCQH